MRYYLFSKICLINKNQKLKLFSGSSVFLDLSALTAYVLSNDVLKLEIPEPYISENVFFIIFSQKPLGYKMILLYCVFLHIYIAIVDTFYFRKPHYVISVMFINRIIKCSCLYIHVS